MKPARREARIVGTGSFVPSRVLTNADLERMVDTSDEWITTRTGIKERRIADDGMATSDMAVEASRGALADAGLGAEELDLVICGTFTPDMLCPATACLVQDRIGARRAAAFDLEAACTGFIYGLVVAKQFIMNGLYRHILVIGADKISAVTDWSDRNTCVLFGDGAGAAIVSAEENGHRITGEYLGADGSTADLLLVPAGGSRRPATRETIEQRQHFLQMNGREVFKNAVAAMANSVTRLLERAGITIDEVAWIIPHQANMRILSAIAKQIGVSESKIYVNVHRLGNMSAASTAVGLDEMARGNLLKPGDRIVVVAFGSGFTWGACLIQW